MKIKPPIGERLQPKYDFVVQKFGGSALADVDKIKQVAQIIKSSLSENNKIIAVVSAMQDQTNRLLNLCREVSPNSAHQSQSEMDVVVSSGEQVSAGLLAMALHAIGVSSRSWLNFQLNIMSFPNYMDGSIRDIQDIDHLIKSFEIYDVAIVAGFQAIATDGTIVTLGRGGSDATAAALAFYTKSTRCEIFKDVPGVQTSDPNYCSNVKTIHQLSYREMLEISGSGAKILQLKAAELLMEHNLPLHIKSLADPSSSGTIVTNCENSKSPINISLHPMVHLVKFTNLANEGSPIQDILHHLKDVTNHNLGSFCEKSDRLGYVNYVVAIPSTKIQQIEGFLSTFQQYKCHIFKDCSIVSIVGTQMDEFRVAQKIQDIFAENQIKIVAIKYATLKISIFTEGPVDSKIIDQIHDRIINCN